MKNSTNIDMSQLMKMLSKMDKKDLENGMNKLNTILGSDGKNKIIDTLKNNMNKN